MNDKLPKVFTCIGTGLSTNLLDCSLAGALGDGATPKSLPIAKIERMVAAARTLPPPKWPARIDAALAEKGKGLYVEHCARCHAPRSELVNVPLDLRGSDKGSHVTDSNRLAMWNTPDQSGKISIRDLQSLCRWLSLGT